MKAIMVMFDSLNRHLLEPYGCDWTDVYKRQQVRFESVGCVLRIY